MRIVTFFILLMWSVSSPSQNLVINGDFDDGLNGWASENATAAINSTDGLPSAPSAQLMTVNGASAPGDKDTLFDHIDFRVAGSTPVRVQSFGVD